MDDPPPSRPPGSVAPRATRHARRAALVAALVLASAALACGGGDDADGGADDIGLEARPRDPGDAGEVRAAIESLLRDHDRVVNQIVVGPAVVNDPAAPLVREYVALYEPGSEAVDRAIDAWADQAAAGRSTQPASPDHPAFSSRLDGEVEPVSEGEVRFPTCDEQRYGIVDAAGTLVELRPEVQVRGEGTAVLVEGRWRIRRLDVIAGAEGCREEES